MASGTLASMSRPTWARTSLRYETMAAGRAALLSYSDDGKNTECCWSREGGGLATRIKYRCAMHLDCAVQLRLVGDKASGVALERSAGVDHANELDEYDRANAALTKEQKREFRDARRYGGTASDIMKNHQADALKKVGGKRNLVDTGVEGALQQHALCFPHVNACE